MTDRRGLPGWLEGNASTLFLVAGGLAVVFGANTALRTFVGTSYPIVQGLVGPTGFLLGVVGLFGLYPALADRTPRLARIAAAVAAIPAVGWPLILAVGIADNVLGLLNLSEIQGILSLVVIVTMVLAFGLFGVTSLRAGVRSRVVGALLLVESAMFLLLILNVVPFVLTDVGHVVAYLGIGVTLRTEGVPTGSAEPTADADAAP
jgi:hypothetical protein